MIAKAHFYRALDSVEQLDLFLEDHPEVISLCFLGRSNVGKSSLINALFTQKTAKTSKTPGRTQAINVFSFHLPEIEEYPFYFFDLPGYGHAQVSKSMKKGWNQLMDHFFATLHPETLCIQIQDARHPHQKADQAFTNYIKEFNLNFILTFNKMDKLKRQKERSAFNKELKSLSSEYLWVREIYKVSALSKQGIDPLKETIEKHLLHHYEQLEPSVLSE